MEGFNILDLFGHEHEGDAQAEAMVEFGQRLGHSRNCETALDAYLDHANLTLHVSCPACRWRTVMCPEVVESIAAPIRRRMALSQSPLARRARHMQLAEYAPLN